MAIKLNKLKRWNPIRSYIREKRGINVHFSSKHCNYYTAWAYVTKEDGSFLESPDHPDLTNAGPPRTMAASQTLVRRTCTSAESASEKEASCSDSGEEDCSRKPDKKSRHKARLSIFEVSEIAVSKGIKSRTELLALAN